MLLLESSAIFATSADFSYPIFGFSAVTSPILFNTKFLQISLFAVIPSMHLVARVMFAFCNKFIKS